MDGNFKISDVENQPTHSSIAKVESVGGLQADIEQNSIRDTRSELKRDEWLRVVCAELETLVKLKMDWDGYGAEAIGPATTNFASMLLHSIWIASNHLPIPDISPMSSGAVMIEWRCQECELTVEVEGPNSVSVLFENLADDVVTEFQITSDFTRISDLLEMCVPQAAAA